VKITWTEQADADRTTIREYIAQDNPLAAIKLDERFAEQARQLVKTPDIGRSGTVRNTRERVVHPNYILIYKVVGDLVLVLRVIHAARKWP
jgi:addiction module RelE/StbE family toxin